MPIGEKYQTMIGSRNSAGYPRVAGKAEAARNDTLLQLNF
jgi:hypothetical protein